MKPNVISAIVSALLILATGCSRRVPIVTMPVVPLRTAPTDASAAERFGRLFCTVLAQEKADPGAWDYCAAYLTPAGTPTSERLPTLTLPFRVAVVPGILGQCIEAHARPFSDAAEHLLAAHGIPVEYISVSALGGVGYNAKQIADYMAREFPKDPRKYIVFGYSKGASDLLEAIHAHESVRLAVAAVVTIAGTVLGSRLPEGVPPGLLDAARDTRVGSCDIGDGKGPESLKRAPRAQAMTTLRLGGIRAFSLAAASQERTTRPVLRNGWRKLSAYSLEQDSQVIHEDAIAPGGAYLGRALGDHWAVALPFERIRADDADSQVARKLFAFRDYPRGALFEAVLRYVAEDLTR